MLISRTSLKLAGDEFIIKKFLDDLKSKLPFKKKLTDEEEEYETEEEELEEDEEEESESNKRTQLLDTSSAEDAAYELSDDEDEDYEEETDEENVSEEPQSLKGKIQSQLDQVLKKISSLGKKKSTDNESDGEEEKTQTNVSVAKPANKNKLIIQGVIFLGLLYFVADEILKEDEPQAPAPQLKARPDKVPQDSEPTAGTDTAIPTDDSLAEDNSNPPVGNDIDQGLSEALPADDIGLDNPPETNAPDLPTESIGSVTEEPPVFNDEPPVTTEEPPIIADETTPTEETPAIDGDSLFGGEGGVGQGDMFGDLASPIEDSDGDLTEKILQDLENQTKTSETVAPAQYVAPPDYEYPGRGLVYNCKALHWACVDGPSYKTCEENAAYLKDKKQKPECYPFNIYETSKGCTAMQNRMVSSGSNTDFCKSF